MGVITEGKENKYQKIKKDPDQRENQSVSNVCLVVIKRWKLIASFKSGIASNRVDVEMSLRIFIAAVSPCLPRSMPMKVIHV